jgi:dipeptidyl aminopeptidase/acylaminoacyl peptidase
MNTRLMLLRTLCLLAFSLSGCAGANDPSSAATNEPTRLVPNASTASPTMAAQPSPTLPPTNLPPTATPSPSPTATAVPPPTSTPLAGGGLILFSSNRAGGLKDLYLFDLTTNSVQRLTRGDSNVFAGPFSPDGMSFLCTAFGVFHSYIARIDMETGEAVNLSGEIESDEGFPAWSPDGTQIVFTSRRDGNNELYLMKADGSEVTRLTRSAGDDFGASWSPDGAQIAFVSDRNGRPGEYAVYLMNVDGSNVRRLTREKEIDYTPQWSPDGSQIIFRALQGGQSDIHIIEVDGTGRRNLTNHSAEERTRVRDGNWEIYVMDRQPDLTRHPGEDDSGENVTVPDLVNRV